MKKLAIYLIVTFGLAWGLLIPSGMALGTFAHGESSSPIMLVLIAISMFFPLIGTLVANRLCGSDQCMYLAWKPYIRQNLGNYLTAIVVPFLVAVLGIALFFILMPQWFDPTMDYYLRTMAESSGMSVTQLAEQMPPLSVMLVGFLVICLTIAPLINAIPAFGEEVGWRGMLYPLLCEHVSCRSAAIISGVVWGIWHAPAIVMGHNYGMAYAGFPLVGILVMTLACVALACFLSWLRDASGSIWPCAVAHGAFNAVANGGVVFCAVGQTPLGPSALGLLAGLFLFPVGFACWLRLPAMRRQEVKCHVPDVMIHACEARDSHHDMIRRAMDHTLDGKDEL